MASDQRARRKSRGRSRPRRPDPKAGRTHYERRARHLVESLTVIAAPLKGLTREQQASVAALLVLTRVAAAQSEGLLAARSPSLTRDFWAALQDVCPPLPTGIERKLPSCLDEEIAYAAAIANCLADGKSERECERLHAGKLAAAVLCRMHQLETVPGILATIPGRAWPPELFPGTKDARR